MKTKRMGAAWVAVLCSIVLVAGAAALVSSPASAKASINWGHIWKTQLQPRADKRYYTKKKARAKFATKSMLGNYYSKTESDARYALLGSSYSKAESDAKYASYPTTIRGSYFVVGNGPIGAQFADNISYGVNLAAAPTPHYILSGTTPPTGCSGTVAAPAAAPGQLCIFEQLNNNSTTTRGAVSATGTFGASSTFGSGVYATVAAAGQMYVYGSWALGVPAGGIVAKVSAAPAHASSSGQLGR
jgi:hypothetical protein